jgi:hypothetical protein
MDVLASLSPLRNCKVGANQRSPAKGENPAVFSAFFCDDLSDWIESAYPIV